MNNEKDTFTPSDSVKEHSILDLLASHGIVTVKPGPVCTCSELQKHRMICPVCDKEEYDSWQGNFKKRISKPYSK